jgi:anti-sigma B factor antagonist
MRAEMTMVPGGHVVVALTGEIDIVTAPVARDLLAEAASEAVTGITVDLGEVTFLDAAGLGVLAGASGNARHLPGGFRLVAVPARVLRLLMVTGLDRHLATFPAPPGSRAQRERAAPLAAVTGLPAGAP